MASSSDQPTHSNWDMEREEDENMSRHVATTSSNSSIISKIFNIPDDFDDNLSYDSPSEMRIQMMMMTSMGILNLLHKLTM